MRLSLRNGGRQNSPPYLGARILDPPYLLSIQTAVREQTSQSAVLGCWAFLFGTLDDELE